jgi:hypothetical protein
VSLNYQPRKAFSGLSGLGVGGFAGVSRLLLNVSAKYKPFVGFGVIITLRRRLKVLKSFAYNGLRTNKTIEFDLKSGRTTR